MLGKLTVFLGFLLFFSAPVFAQPAVDSPACEPWFQEVLNIRAATEAQREMEVASVLILKPDSTLEYSCLDSNFLIFRNASAFMLSANDGPRLFVIPPWEFIPLPPPFGLFNPTIMSQDGPVPLIEGPGGEGIIQESYPPDPTDNPYRYPGSDHATQIVQRMLYDANDVYIDNNFYHTTSGGKHPVYIGPPPCDMMQQVWDFSRCSLNFDKETFYSFSDLFSDDPRKLPRACDQFDPTAAAERTEDWRLSIEIMNLPPDDDETTVNADIVYSYLQGMEHNNVGGNDCASSHVIETGLTIRIDGDPVPERICTLPGCSFIEGRCR